MLGTTPPEYDVANGRHLNDPGAWTSQRFDPGISQVSLSKAISAHTAHEWQIERPMELGSSGYSRFRKISDARIVSFAGESGFCCLHDKKAARRTSRQDLSIIHAADGDMQMDIAGRQVSLKSGMFTITDSAQPMTLDVPSGFRHMYYIFPKSRVLSIFPFAEDFVGVPLGIDEGLTSLFLDHLSLIEQSLCNFDEQRASAILDVTLNLLGVALGSVDGHHIITPRERQLIRVKAHIEQRLADSDLDIASIAEENRINIRYLHKIFDGTGVTVSNWIRKRRLTMCRRDLGSPALAQRNITEIAFRWGFNDMSHFSKSFKREFGVGPREYRDRLGLDDRTIVAN